MVSVDKSLLLKHSRLFVKYPTLFLFSYFSVLLRNCEPCHKDKYPAAQVLKDCQEIGGNFVVDELLNRKIRDLSTDYCFETQDEVVLEQEVCKENFVDLFIQMAFVESRRRAIVVLLFLILKSFSFLFIGIVDLAHVVFSKTPIGK